MTIYFIRDLISGKKKRIYGKDLRYIQIPQYEGLSIKDIAAFTNEYGSVAEYLPDGKEIHKTPKQWIANVCNTVMKDVFADWVSEQIKIRNLEMQERKGLMIEMDAEVAEVFQASTKSSGK